MTLIERPAPLPDTNAPQRKLECHCAGDPDVQRLRAMIADGVPQVEASHLLWPPPPAPVVPVELPPAITPRPSRSTRHLNDWMNRGVS